MNFQQEHEMLMTALDALAGKRVRDFFRDTAHLNQWELAEAKHLNRRNDLAVANYYRQSREWLREHR